MKLSLEPVKKMIEELKKVPPKPFVNSKAARKRWLVTQDDRVIYQKTIRDKLLADLEAEKQLRKGR